MYVEGKHPQGVGVSAWALFEPEVGAITSWQNAEPIHSNSTRLLSLNALIAGLPKTPEGAKVTCISSDAKLVDMAQRLAEYRRSGFSSSGKPLANRDKWLLLADLVSRRSVEFRGFRGIGEDRRIRAALLERIQSAVSRNLI